MNETGARDMQSITTGTSKQNAFAEDVRYRKIGEFRKFAEVHYTSDKARAELNLLIEHLETKDHRYWIDHIETHHIDIAQAAAREIVGK